MPLSCFSVPWKQQPAQVSVITRFIDLVYQIVCPASFSVEERLPLFCRALNSLEQVGKS